MNSLENKVGTYNRRIRRLSKNIEELAELEKNVVTGRIARNRS